MNSKKTIGIVVAVLGVLLGIVLIAAGQPAIGWGVFLVGLALGAWLIAASTPENATQ